MVLYRHLISCLHKNKVKVSFNVHVLKLKRNKVENEALHCLNVHSMIAQYKNAIDI